MNNLNDFSDEVLIAILSFLPTLEKYGANARLVCKRWNSLMSTRTYARQAYSYLNLYNVAEEFYEVGRIIFCNKIAPHIFSHYIGDFTRSLHLFHADNRLLELADKFDLAPEFFYIRGFNYVDNPNQLLSSKKFTRRLREVTVHLPSRNRGTALFFPELTLPTCKKISLINCRPAEKVIAQLFDIPTIKRLTVSDNFTFSSSVWLQSRLLTLNRFIENYSGRPSSKGKTLVITFNGILFSVAVYSDGKFGKNSNWDAFCKDVTAFFR